MTARILPQYILIPNYINQQLNRQKSGLSDKHHRDISAFFTAAQPVPVLQSTPQSKIEHLAADIIAGLHKGEGAEHND